MSSENRQQDDWQQRPLQERMQESASWAAWAPGLTAALVEGLKRHFELEDGINSTDVQNFDLAGPRLCPIADVALNRRDCRVGIEAAGRSRPHRKITHPSAYCPTLDLSGRLKAGKDQFNRSHKYFMIGCYTFPTTLDDLRLTGPGRDVDPEDVPLPSLDEVVEEDGVSGDVEDHELPRLEIEDQVLEEGEGDEQPQQTAKTSLNSWMKIVEHCEDVKVKTLTFVEVIS